MKKFIYLLVFSIFLPCHAATMTGGVEKEGMGYSNKIVDSETLSPIEHAQVSIPKKGYRTYTDKNGKFNLGAKIDGQTILSVEKEGYKPFSATIDETIAARPLVVGIEKVSPSSLSLESLLIHIGDNNFSEDSANAGDFKTKSVGPYYSKDFRMSPVPSGKQAYLTFGSIIGIDTAMAKSLRQNRIASAFASPPEVYFNGNKIAEIQINGDNQKIKIPSSLIFPNSPNQVTIKSGRNLMQSNYVDYDDIEFINLSIEYK